ncbi:hypothetical protein AMIS_20250 [Actinoplanes missouriensis 431]|uniref:Uncharacterized protein n=1 Tax=Actinoplanes missouriensis (strain ATCC 14538 / DSM 43046 / CBS 188.64 / JCM 3121 / NBRC 102363 / NCIMB 12654 / NRRL B-3342 / UNCC 431) TaxID=512565 RepID=I0H2K8_ACTM4|nr:hypothetical protein [Actinoplanes missouriensis]BAL87245.1 hypothetical protein AMIS_20250 [Actinoplanes missouriensis 431]
MSVKTFAYRFLGEEWHRGEFDSGVTAERFGEELFRLEPNQPTDEIFVWEGRDTDRAPDAVVRQVA